MNNNKLTKANLRLSSRLLKKYLLTPEKNRSLSIDNLAITLPVPIDHVKDIYKFLTIRTADVSVTLISLNSKERIAQKYKKKIFVQFYNGSSLSIFCYGLNDGMNQVKIEFNPNTVGHKNIDFVFGYLRKLFGESNMLDWLQRAKVTSIHYAQDFANIPFSHIVIDYAYSPKYETFSDVDSQVFSTIRFGNKKGCPIIIYDKVLEQGGEYNGYDSYTRLEKQHRPQQRGRKSMFTLAELDKQKYSFQGIGFYSPLILSGMPDKIMQLINEYGISKAKDFLTPSNRSILMRRMKEYKIVIRTSSKAAIIDGFQIELKKLKSLLLNESIE